MSTTVVTPGQEQATEVKFDSKAFIQRQNEAAAAKLAGKEPPKPAETAAKPGEGGNGADKGAKPSDQAPKDQVADGNGDNGQDGQGEHTPRMSRSQRREHNRLLRENGELVGRVKALEEQLGKQPGAQPAAKAEPASDADPEPKQADFADHNEYIRALSRWEGRQEARKETAKAKGQTEQENALRASITAADEKFAEDVKGLDDWADVAKEAQEDGPEFIPGEHPQLMTMLATSDQRAFILYHFAKHPAELEKMLDLTDKPQEQIRQFHRLEGRVERLYAKDPAAQAGEKGKTPDPKDRTTPEKAEQARETAADRDARKPKPTTEVAARGGTAPPEQPAIGSKAWMEQRNRAQFVSR